MLSGEARRIDRGRRVVAVVGAAGPHEGGEFVSRSADDALVAVDRR